ncbi:cbb3-type cytochrome c oxidase subunit I [Paenibacillus mesophilus]|uniref:cbb3-type cytochrome c oxidase subunit I n=1 Tax=Paenibacillus mesophilus TaxID=2582849 RepID=UPI00110F5675|nr:cbb3-type cytochrome c oxidase subunit I [Paenibacillus mesophilus]TMV51229.1 cbb3-type cytochrome c oxidase subunit I [Paenibacillus mesophilus]
MGARFIQVSVIYFLIGVVMGLAMGIAEAFRYTSAHAHINLLGWASLAIIGVIYTVYPDAGKTKLAGVQFWLHNIGLPLLVISMFMFAHDNKGVGIPTAAIGGLLVIASVVLFVINVLRKVRQR